MEGVGIQEENLVKQEPNQRVSLLALDIGGSLIKMVYFSKSSSYFGGKKNIGPAEDGMDASIRNLSYGVSSGRIHFLKFETSQINECLQFISSKILQHYGDQDEVVPDDNKSIIKATGGGAFKFADLFKEKLGIILDKVDEMRSLVTGANFLLKAVSCEAFTYMDGKKGYVRIEHKDMYPYLLVNIGSGVSMIKIGLSSTNIASSFGKVISENKNLEDCCAEDVAKSLLRMISNNIGQIAYLNALRFGLKRIFFGGFFICGHADTMDNISVAVKYWSKGEAKALFLCHEGFLGAFGSFLSYRENGIEFPTHESMEL